MAGRVAAERVAAKVVVATAGGATAVLRVAVAKAAAVTAAAGRAAAMVLLLFLGHFHLGESFQRSPVFPPRRLMLRVPACC